VAGTAAPTVAAVAVLRKSLRSIAYSCDVLV
jgi:hypothetical protein